MKRFLALAITVIFVLGFAATAFALDVTGKSDGIDFSGQYRLRAMAKDNVNDQEDASPDKLNYYDQRLRLQIKFKVGDDVSVVTRGDIAEGVWDGTGDTLGATTGTFDVDHAYMTVKKLGGTFTLGVQPANWGNKFWSWGGIKERIKYVTKIGDSVTLGAFTQKNDETGSGNGGGDSDSYSVLGVFKIADAHKVSFIYVETNNNVAAVTTNDSTAMDIAYVGKAGPVNIAAEFVALDSDATNTDKGGFFLAGNMDVNDMINVGLAYATASNGFATSGYFTPTLMVGTTQATGVLNLGNNVDGAGGNIEYDATASAIVLSGKFKITDDLSLGANFASAVLDDNGEALGTGDDTELTEIDLYANYKLATNTKLFVGYAMGTPGDKGFGGSPKDDTITSAAATITTSF